MFIPLGGYGLSVRSQKKSVEESTGSRSKVRKKKAILVSEMSPNQKLVWEALYLIYQIRSCLKEYAENFHQLSSVSHRALDLKISDNDRRLFNRQYQGYLKRIEDFVKSTSLRDVVIFDGTDKNNKPMTVVLSEDGEEVMTVDLPGLDLESLRLKDTRIDSIVHARKADKYVNDGEARISEIFATLDSKNAALDLKRANLGLPVPNFDKNSGDASVFYEEDTEPEEENLEVRSPQLLELRDRQQKAARAKGRLFGLLINTRI